MTKNFRDMYKNELIQLRKNEDEAEFFYEILVDNMRSDREFAESLLFFLMRFCSKYNLNRTHNGLNNFQAWIYHIDREYDISVDIGLKGYYKAEEYGDFNTMSRMCNLLMSNYSELGLIDIAIEWGNKGISIAEKLQAHKILFSLYINMAIGYMQVKDYKNVKSMLHNIKSENIESTDERKIPEYQLRAELAIINRDIELARQCFIELDNLLYNLSFEFYRSEVQRLYGMYNHLIGKNKLAVEYFSKSYENAMLMNNTSDICNCLYSWAKLYFYMEEYDKSREKLLQCVSVAEDNNLIYPLIDAYELVILIYEKSGNYLSAYTNLKKISSLKETLSNKKAKKYYDKIHEIAVDRENMVYKKLYDKLYNLSELGKKIISTFEVDEIISILDRGMRPLMIYNVFSIIMYDETDDLIIGKYINHIDGKIESSDEILEYRVENFNKVDTLSSFCIKNKKEILINDIEDFNKYIDSDSKYYTKLIDDSSYRSYIFVPLLVKDKLIGLLTVQTYQKNAYSLNEVNSLNILSNYISIALENSNEYKNIEKMAKYDNLTGLYVRNEIVKICKKNIEERFEYNSIIVVDIDKFKKINDNFGHIEGDNIIREVAQVMKKSARNSDFIGRYGGDEFLIFLTDTKEELAYIIADRIRKEVNNSIIEIENGVSLNISISMGVYTFECGENFDEGFKKADKALYIAKDNGGNKTVIYSSLLD